jgi:hypothetical protein
MKLRFSIRDLLWLTALCAVLVAWLIQSRRLTGQLDKFETQLQEAMSSLAAQEDKLNRFEMQVDVITRNAESRVRASEIKMVELQEKLIQAQQ